MSTNCPFVELSLASACHLTQMWRTLREEDLYPYNDHRVQRPEPRDSAEHIDVCELITAHPQLLTIILFTDEASFTQDGINN